MREEASVERIRQLMAELGKRAKGPGRIYFTGGATALLEGWRDSTKDVDLKLQPEPAGIFEAIRDLKDELSINIELAAPDEFIPAAPGWEERSKFVGRFGEVDFFHYDLVSQALAKIERGHGQDKKDVAAMLSRGLIGPEQLRASFEAIKPGLIRFPGIDANAFADRLDAALTGDDAVRDTVPGDDH